MRGSDESVARCTCAAVVAHPLAEACDDRLGRIDRLRARRRRETGTIVLDGSAACGRRALTLVVGHHICVVRAAQIIAGVPDAIAVLRRGDAARRPITLVSGPSATSDIELERVEGVHGPRRLDVVLVS